MTPADGPPTPRRSTTTLQQYIESHNTRACTLASRSHIRRVAPPGVTRGGSSWSDTTAVALACESCTLRGERERPEDARVYIISEDGHHYCSSLERYMLPYTLFFRGTLAINVQYLQHCCFFLHSNRFESSSCTRRNTESSYYCSFCCIYMQDVITTAVFVRRVQYLYTWPGEWGGSSA